MKSFILILNLILSLAYASEINANLTDEMAEDLGMTRLEDFEQFQKIQAVDNFLKNVDLQDDRINSRRAKIVAIINEGDRSIKNPLGQTLSLYEDGILIDIFTVSTGSNKLLTTSQGNQYISATPLGFFRPKRVYDEYYSNSFFGSNMRFAVFFHEGIATHATEHTDKLGTRASGGCVRMLHNNAYDLNEKIQATGENHRKTSTEEICNDEGVCYNRTLYLNRIKLPDINRSTAKFSSEKIWTYDALIIVKPGL